MPPAAMCRTALAALRMEPHLGRGAREWEGDSAVYGALQLFQVSSPLASASCMQEATCTKTYLLMLKSVPFAVRQTRVVIRRNAGIVFVNQ